MERRESFNNAAKTYDQARPSYPEEVIDWIIDKTQISKDKTLLEIAPGTGQATMKFAQRGYSLHCVELGENLAQILRQKAKDYDVTVDVSSFEAWEPKKSYKAPLIFCATAFHWIDPSIRYKKCYDLLEDDGHLVLMWNIAHDSKLPQVQRAYHLLWEYYPEKNNQSQKKNDIKGEQKQDIINSGIFEVVDYLDYKWQWSQTRENLLKGFFSQSSYLSLEDEKRKVLTDKIKDLFSTLNDVVEEDFSTTVYIARKNTKLIY